MQKIRFAKSVSAALRFLCVCMVPFLFGIVISNAEATDATFPPSLARVERCSSEKAFERLKEGTPVRYLIRLIAYDPAKESFLSARELKTLGVPDQRYIFVADHDELKGYTVLEAMSKVGTPVRAGQHVTAILFPANGREVFPANARGVLHAIHAVDQYHANLPQNDADYRPANLTQYLTRCEIDQLASYPQSQWVWRKWGPTHRRDTDIVLALKNIPVSAFHFLGTIDSDWNSLGYAKAMGKTDLPKANYTLSLGCEKFPLENFGVRVLFTNNQNIADLTNATLLDFCNPQTDRIPFLNRPNN
ncbi:MAG: hypothetical protein U1D30_10105 [Planctomycetota bacterium]